MLRLPYQLFMLVTADVLRLSFALAATSNAQNMHQTTSKHTLTLMRREKNMKMYESIRLVLI